jgi:CubicO group peptidase (beta-lactamase class C family)
MFRRTAIAFFLATACLAQDQPQNDVPARMEQVVQSFVPDKQFMGAVLVARDGRMLLDKGYGFANLE